MKKLLTSLAVAGVAFGAGISAQAAGHAECGDVTMAEMNWASAELMANVDKIILEAGYGCSVELIAGATMPTFASMQAKAQPDVAGELWINAFREPLQNAIDAGEMVVAVDGPITDLGEGWWVPAFTLENNPEIKTVLDIIERPDLFPHPEDSSKGGIYTCPSGWNCQLSTNNLFRAFDMEAKGWKLVDPGSAAGLDGAIAKAATREENWFGYYWSPTATAGKYDLQLVPFGVDFAGQENWNCLASETCDDPQPSAWVKSEVQTVVTSAFAERGGPAMDYLSGRIFPGPVMNGMLVYMTENQANGEDAAFKFLEDHEAIWTKWVSDEVAENVRAAL